MPTMKFANKSSEELLTLSEARKLDEYGGVLADDVLVIDFDDTAESDLMLRIIKEQGVKCRVIATDKGKHFYFLNTTGAVKKSGTRLKLACGLGVAVDIKAGINNSYIKLKKAGVEREVIYDTGEYEEIPKWLIPVKSNVDFNKLGEGDGRNQALFNYILTLQSHELEKEEIKESIKILNKYILSEPLSERELNVILRDDAFSAPVFFNKNGGLLLEKFCKYLIKNYHVIKMNNRLHIYKEGIYSSDYKEIEHRMIELIPNLTKTKRNEVLAYLDVMIRKNTPGGGADWIAFKNGIYNIKTNEFADFSPEIIIGNKIPFDYNKNAQSEICDATINKLCCHDKEIRAILEEMIGYCFYRRNELGKAFILLGDKSNGKSTFLAMIKNLLGEENISALDMKELDRTFQNAELFGKLANIGDDISDEYIPDTAIFKKFVTGDRVQVQKKGQDPFEFNNYAKFLFSANELPRVKDKTGAILRRLIIVPFKATFSKSDPDYDPYIKYKLLKDDSMEYMIQLGLQGLTRVLERNGFTESKQVEEKLEEYDKQNNPIELFFEEYEIDKDKILNEPVADIYRAYEEFSINYNIQKLSKIAVSKQIMKKYGLTTRLMKIGGKPVKVYAEA